MMGTWTVRNALLLGFFSLGMMLWVIPSLASAQTATSDLSQAIERDARTLIERHITPDSYQLIITVTPKQKSMSDVPYMPENLAGSVPNIFGSWTPYVDRVEIEVLLADRFGAPTRTKLKAIIEKKLGLDLVRGDKVTFSSLGIEVAQPKSEVETALLRAEADARDAKGRVEAITRDREDAKRDLSLAQSELEKVRAEAVKAAATPNPQNPPTNVAKDGGNAGLSNELLLYVGIAASLILLAAIIFGSITVRGAAKTIGQAVSSVGEGLPLLGEKIGEGMSARAMLPEAAGAGPKLLEAAPKLPQGSAMPAIAPESLQKRILTLHDELLAAFNEKTESIMLRHLSQMLLDPELVGKAVVTMEILGKDKANGLYNKLGSDQQMVVFDFLEHGYHRRNKAEIMIEAGEELKTKLMGESFEGVRGKVSGRVVERLLKLRHNDLVAIVKEAPLETLPRLFLYLEPSRLGQVLDDLMVRDQGRFARVSQHIVKMPDSIQAIHLDTELLRVLDERLLRAKDDTQRTFFSYYKSLIQSVSDRAAEHLSETLTASNANVGNFIRENVITFATFFKLHGDIKEEILDAMVTKDVAALLAGLRDDLKLSLLEHLDVKQRELVREEAERIAAKGVRHSQTVHKQAKEMVLARILTLKGDGPLAELLAQESEGLLVSGSSRSENAA
jgi:hypothetical protein